MNKATNATDAAKKFFKDLGARIREIRKEKGLSQYWICLQYGYPETMWRKAERGGGLTIESIIRIASMLGVSFNQLLEGIEVPEVSLQSVTAPQRVAPLKAVSAPAAPTKKSASKSVSGHATKKATAGKSKRI